MVAADGTSGNLVVAASTLALLVGARSVFGGVVAITCTEALAISVEKAEKK